MSRLPPAVRATSAFVALAMTLAACAQAPLGPSVQALPGPGKSFADFQQDNSICLGLAQAQIGDAQNQLNQQQGGAAVAGVLLGAALGAALGGGRGAAIGAGTGLAAGAAAGSDVAANNAATLQQRYDLAFSQCMFAKGNEVPGVTPAVAGYYPGGRPGSDPLVRSIQSELVRTGYLSGGVDGNYGPRTGSAIADFERSHGMMVDASPSSDLLARLRSSPGVTSSRAASRGSSTTPASSVALVSPVTSVPSAGAGQGSLVQPVAAVNPSSGGLVAPVTGPAINSQ